MVALGDKSLVALGAISVQDRVVALGAIEPGCSGCKTNWLSVCKNLVALCAGVWLLFVQSSLLALVAIESGCIKYKTNWLLCVQESGCSQFGCKSLIALGASVLLIWVQQSLFALCARKFGCFECNE